MINFNQFKKLKKSIIKEGILSDIQDNKLDKYINDAYKYFKEIKKPVNTKDIMDYIEKSIGKELDDDDYELLYKKITGEDLTSDEISDLDDEDKFIIK